MTLPNSQPLHITKIPNFCIRSEHWPDWQQIVNNYKLSSWQAFVLHKGFSSIKGILTWEACNRRVLRATTNCLCCNWSLLFPFVHLLIGVSTNVIGHTLCHLNILLPHGQARMTLYNVSHAILLQWMWQLLKEECCLIFQWSSDCLLETLTIMECKWLFYIGKSWCVAAKSMAEEKMK